MSNNMSQVRNNNRKEVLFLAWHKRETELSQMFYNGANVNNLMLTYVEMCFDKLLTENFNTSQNSKRMNKILKILRDPKEMNSEEKKKNLLFKVKDLLNCVDLENILEFLDGMCIKHWINSYEEDIPTPHSPPFTWMYEDGILKSKYSLKIVSELR